MERGGKKRFLSPAEIDALLSLFQTLFPKGRKREKKTPKTVIQTEWPGVLSISPREVLSVPLVAGVGFTGRIHNTECCQGKYETANLRSATSPPSRCSNVFGLLLKLKTPKKKKKKFLGCVAFKLLKLLQVQ